MRTLALLMFVSILLAFPIVREASTPTFASAQLPTNTPAPSPTSTVVPSPTPTKPPARTPSLGTGVSQSPTPTPKGLFVSDLGFSFVLPPLYSFEEVYNKRSLYFRNPTYPLNLQIYYESFPECNIEEREKYGRSNIGGKTEESSEVQLGDGSPLARVLIKSTKNFMEIGVINRGTKCLILYMWGPIEGVESARKALDTVYASLDLDSGWLYGVNRSEGLVSFGGLYGKTPEAIDLDPAVTELGVSSFATLLYSGLVQVSPKLQIEPNLAESWKVSDDSKVYTFTLKERLTFADGKPITAQHFKDSWERAADPETKSTTARTYLGDILGVKDKLDGKAEEISGVRAIDDRTLEVKLEAPAAHFLAKLTYPTSFVVDTDQTEAEKWFMEPNASGPFTLRQYKEDLVLVFERNEAYHTPSTLGNIVFLLTWYGEPTSYFKNGDVDISAVHYYQVEEVEDPKNPLSEQLHEVTQMCTSYIALDNTKPPLDDPNVRKALSLAVDKERLIEVITEGHAERADSILPPGMPGFSDEFSRQPFDATLAKETLAASKYGKNVPSITLLASGSSNPKIPTIDDLYIKSLVEMWQKNLGLRVSVKYIAPKDFDKSARKAKAQLVYYDKCADYPDPQNFLDVQFHSQSELNYANYTKTEIDQLLEKARAEQDVETRLALFHQIEAALLEDYAAIPLYHPVVHRLVSPRIQGWVDTPMVVPIWPRLSMSPLIE